MVAYALTLEAAGGYPAGTVTVLAASVDQAIGKLPRRARGRVIYAESA